MNVVTCLREFAQFLTRYALNFHSEFLTTHPILVICEKINVDMKTKAHIYVQQGQQFLELISMFSYDLMNGVLLLRCENQ